jgi:hypothetical protein
MTVESSPESRLENPWNAQSCQSTDDGSTIELAGEFVSAVKDRICIASFCSLGDASMDGLNFPTSCHHTLA